MEVDDIPVLSWVDYGYSLDRSFVVIISMVSAMYVDYKESEAIACFWLVSRLDGLLANQITT